MSDDLPIVIDGITWKAPRFVKGSLIRIEEDELKHKRIRIKLLNEELAKAIVLDIVNDEQLLRIIQMMESPDEENFTMAEAIVEQLHENRRLKEQSLNGRKKSKVWKR